MAARGPAPADVDLEERQEEEYEEEEEPLIEELEATLEELTERFLIYLAQYIGHFEAGVRILETTLRSRSSLKSEETAIELFHRPETEDLAQYLARALQSFVEIAVHSGLEEFEHIQAPSPREISNELVRSEKLTAQGEEAQAVRSWMDTRMYARFMEAIFVAIDDLVHDEELTPAQLRALEELKNLGDRFQQLRNLVRYVLEQTKFPHELRNQMRLLEREKRGETGKLDLTGVANRVRRPTAPGGEGLAAEVRAREVSGASSRRRSRPPAPEWETDAAVDQMLSQHGLTLASLPTAAAALASPQDRNKLYMAFTALFPELLGHLGQGREREAAFLALLRVCKMDPSHVGAEEKAHIEQILHDVVEAMYDEAGGSEREGEVETGFQKVLQILEEHAAGRRASPPAP